MSVIEGLLKAANSSPDADSSANIAKRIFLQKDDCDSFYATTCSNLVDIGEWNKNSSATSYDLFREDGTAVGSEHISVGDFIRIALYGGGKFDWVRVISIRDVPDEFVLTVKPSWDPTRRPVDPNSISHFFGPEATNNFCVQRVGKTVAFHVIGLNERQNTKFTDGLVESARNLAIANIGYFTGLQKSVWKEFCSNFVATEEERES